MYVRGDNLATDHAIFGVWGIVLGGFLGDMVAGCYDMVPVASCHLLPLTDVDDPRMAHLHFFKYL